MHTFQTWLEHHELNFYARISKPNPGATILHLSDLETKGLDNVPVSSPDAIRQILAEHPEINFVMFAGREMPRRAVPIEKVDDKLLKKQFT